MAEKKDNTILIRLSDEEMRRLNDGWFRAVSLAGRPITKSEYIRSCIDVAYYKNMNDLMRKEVN